eukprot:m.337864 g.337864  ORF g.337864 m.337864 type:complete len:93 (+) comp18250_c0_seq1:129-407(+)
MAKAHAPELKKYMDKQVKIRLTCSRIVTGILRGFDPFMNTVLDVTVDESSPEKPEIGMVVIRGNSIIMVENLDPSAMMDGRPPPPNPNMNRR